MEAWFKIWSSHCPPHHLVFDFRDMREQSERCIRHFPKPSVSPNLDINSIKEGVWNYSPVCARQPSTWTRAISAESLIVACRMVTITHPLKP